MPNQMKPFETKILEVRDECRCIPVAAIRMWTVNSIQEYYVHYRSGYPRDGTGIVLMRLSDQKATVDPYGWGNRRFGAAHDFIYRKFDSLSNGDVVDVRVILGEAQAPVESERMTVR